MTRAEDVVDYDMIYNAYVTYQQYIALCESDCAICRGKLTKSSGSDCLVTRDDDLTLVVTCVRCAEERDVERVHIHVLGPAVSDTGKIVCATNGVGISRLLCSSCSCNENEKCRFTFAEKYRCAATAAEQELDIRFNVSRRW